MNPLETLKEQIVNFLSAKPDLAYSVDELIEEFHVEKAWLNRAVSQLDDERKVRLRVSKGKVYVHVRQSA